MAESNLKILYITQKVGTSDPILSVFFKWLNLIAKRAQKANAVCLEKGETLGIESNINVISLGKERGEGKRGKIRNFYAKLIPLFRNKEVDVIFVHMSEIFVLLIWPLAFIYRKPIVWWKAHGNLSFKSKIARYLVKNIITSSESGFPINTKKRIITGQGIDTDMFSFTESNEQVKKVLWVGRISPVKNIETLIEADKILSTKGINLNIEIVGDIGLTSQEAYLNKLKEIATPNIKFLGSIPFKEIVTKYKQADIFINTGNTKSLDKTVLEAMSCGTYVINSNIGYSDILKDFPLCQFEHGNYKELASKLEEVTLLPRDKRINTGKALRQIVIDNHNIYNLIDKIINIFTKVCRK